MPTLLLADDSITVQRVIALTFAKEQIRVVTVSDGKQAVERMKTLHPDIVLAGTVLPQVTGYELATHMRTIPGLRNVPVLLLTGAFETVDEEKLKASGATGVLEKPVEPNNVIARVKELLGLKSEAKPAAIGRLVTSADLPGEQRPPVASPPRAVTSTIETPSKGEPSRDEAGRETNTHPVEDASTGSDDYLNTLDAAFDTLDQQLSGHTASEKPSRNPPGPLGQSAGAVDPRSPGRRPEAGASTPVVGNPVFEVDEEWFSADESQARANARAGRREMHDDLSDPGFQAPRPAAAAEAVFEVDDAWFANADRGAQAPEAPHAPQAPRAPDTPEAPKPPDAPKAPEAPQAPKAPQAPDAPAVTDEMLDQVAARVAERLSTGAFGEQLMNAVTTTVRETVREIASQTSQRLSREIATETSERLSREIASTTAERVVREIVSETSERLVRDEIDRIKSRARS